MSSICLYIFSLPPTKWEDKIWDALVVCVDRLSGWIIAKPARHVGLMASKLPTYFWTVAGIFLGCPLILLATKARNLLGSGGE